MGDVITLADLPRAERPGMPGVRVHQDEHDGKVYWAVPYTWSDRSLSYYMPRFESRRAQDAIKRAGGRRLHNGLRTQLCKCARCGWLIGAGYYDHEVYVEPYLARKKGGMVVRVRLICAENAVEHGMGPGYAVVAEHDWTLGVQAIEQAFPAAIRAKARMLLQAFYPAWEAYGTRMRERHAFLQRQWRRTNDRRGLWEQVVAPEWSDYLYHRGMVHVQDWWKVHDLRFVQDPDGTLVTGCPDGVHLRPSECSTGFHEQLFRLDTPSLFEAFRAQYGPATWTITNYLNEQQDTSAAHKKEHVA